MRSLGSKVLNNAKILINSQSTISSQHDRIFPSDGDQPQSHSERKENTRPTMKRMSSSRRRKRQRMHFRPIIPTHYICPITQEMMSDPVIIASGHTFERQAIVEWFQDGNTINPLTGEQLQNTDIKPNYALKDAIKEYRRKLADELFRITFDEERNEEVLYYRENILFSTDSSSEEDEKLINDHHINEHDGYVTDDEEEIDMDANSDYLLDSSHSDLLRTSSTDEHVSGSNCKFTNKRKRRSSLCSLNRRYLRIPGRKRASRNIPILAFMGPNNTGKSTLLNLIVGEPVFVTMDELSDYDTLSKVVRFKIVSRADREFILLDVEGLFPRHDEAQQQGEEISDAVLKIFFAVYSISSVIVWNDTDENNPLLQQMLSRVDTMMHDINRDGEYHFSPYGGYNIENEEQFGHTASGSLLPEELRQFLLKKYKKLSKKQEHKRSKVNIGKACTHKPAFIILRRDFSNSFKSSIIINDESKYLPNTGDHEKSNMHSMRNEHSNLPSSPWLSSDTEHTRSIQTNIPPNSGNLSASPTKYTHYNVHDSPSSFCLSAPNNLSDSGDPSPSPRFKLNAIAAAPTSKDKYQILTKHRNSCASITNYHGTSSGNDSPTPFHAHTAANTSLSIVDELKEDQKETEQEDEENKQDEALQRHLQSIQAPMTDAVHLNLSDSSSLMENTTNSSIVFGNSHTDKYAQSQYFYMKQQRSNSVLFSEYVHKHDDFIWLRKLDLFCFVDGVVLHKLEPCIDDNVHDDDEEMYQDDSLLSIVPKLDKWMDEWCKQTQNVIPIVRTHRDMLSVVKCINKYNVLSSVKYVEECMQIKGSRLQRYFFYDSKERTLNQLKLIAERFQWDNANLMRWFAKHFNRLWYHIRFFPNAHDALLYQSLFHEYYLNVHAYAHAKNKQVPIVPTIVLNFSHFYYQLSNKVDLYQNIVDKSAGWGGFAGGAVSGLGSLSLMSVIHPLVGIAAVPFSIHFGSSLGRNSGAKVGDALANSKAHYVDHTERYDLGKIEHLELHKKKQEDDEIVYHGCYSSDNDEQQEEEEKDDK